MKKLIFLIVMVNSMLYAMAATPKENPDAIIYFDGNDLDYVTPQIAVKLKGQVFIWKVAKTADIQICIKDGYINPFDETMDTTKPRCLPKYNGKIIKAKIKKEFKGIPIPEGGYIEVGYSVESGGITIDPIIQIY